MDKKAAKCTFYGLKTPYDHDLRERMRTALDAVAKEHDSLEFLFYLKDTTYLIFLSEVMRLKAKYPNKDIVLTKVAEINEEMGTTENTAGIYYTNRYNQDFPLSIFDRIRYADEYTGKSKSGDPGYIMHKFHSVQNWIFEQSDIVFSYMYSLLDESENTELQKLEKRKMVIQLGSDRTIQRIMELSDELLDDRKKEIMRRLSEGATAAQIGIKMGVTGSAIRQHSHKASRIIKEGLRKDYLRAQKSEMDSSPVACGIIGLGEQSTRYIHDMYVILRFLAKTYSVFEIYVEQALCFSEIIGPIIPKGSLTYRDHKMIAVLNPSDAIEDETVPITAYCPPYDSMIFTCRDGYSKDAAELVMYKYIIEHSQFVITDFNETPYREEIKNYCAEFGTRLIDIASIPNKE